MASNQAIIDEAHPVDEPLRGRAALVTGGGSGIGRATAAALARRGAEVLVVGRRPDALEETTSLGARIHATAGDVTDPADVERIVERALELRGPLDVLVNNAGAVAPTPLEEANPDAARRLWAVNVLAPTMLAQAVLSPLERAQGSIVNVSSTFGHKPAPTVSQYGASKAALEQLTRSWALELAPRGIRVNAVAPGPTESEALERSGLSADAIDQIKDQEGRDIPLGRRGVADDIAYWIAALADPASGWTTGQVIGVDGGFGLV